MPTVTASSSSEPRAYYTVQQVAERYQVHPDTVREWIRKGTATATRVGGGERPRIRLSAAEVRRLDG